MTITREPIEFQIDGDTFEGMYVRSSANAGTHPLVLVFHHWGGRQDNMVEAAEVITDWGYHGFACDLYGKGVFGHSTEENAALMRPLVDDRTLLEKRMRANISAAADLPDVKAGQLAALGYCFGGLCVLDLARVNADVRGVASMHGLLKPRPDQLTGNIRPRITMFHGWDDPMAPPEDVTAIGRELTARGADWQLHAYGNAMHAFSNPAANDPQNGLKYEAKAARRARASLQDFLHELFAV